MTYQNGKSFLKRYRSLRMLLITCKINDLGSLFTGLEALSFKTETDDVKKGKKPTFKRGKYLYNSEPYFVSSGQLIFSNSIIRCGKYRIGLKKREIEMLSKY